MDSDAGLYTLVKAIRVIQSQFLQTCPHFVPVSHLYAYMREENGTDETDVDIAVEELKKRHLVTCLYMPGVRDVALVETGDYIKAIHHLASNASNLLLKKACEWFEDVVKKYCGPIFPGSGDEQTGSGSKQYVLSLKYLAWHQNHHVSVEPFDGLHDNQSAYMNFMVPMSIRVNQSS